MKVRPPDPETARRYLLRFTGWQLYHETERLPGLSSPELFGNERPLELDVGCGTGEYICHLAQSDPQANFVGVDLHLKSLHKAVKRAAEAGLGNIKFICADFRQMYPLLRPASLRAVYLHFPDPGIKPRYRKRRLFNERFLEEMHRAVAPGGKLSLVTDDEDYFRQMLELIERDRRWRRTHEEPYLTGFNPPVKSRFQRMWERRGRTIYRFELVRPSKDSIFSRTQPGMGTARPSSAEKET
ncbi:MAG: tRNA (guanosine(46)-N7)-methyltransferase TrmB [Rubrobacter sp.]|nr:tRNA (guanosine(46)-N7)-methyltransferase TrmB [Rubrobacter sp.]